MIEELRRRFVAFWSLRTSGASAALFRIAFGSLSTWTAIGVGLNVDRYFAPDGMIPWRIIERHEYASWSLFAMAPESAELAMAVFVLFLVSSILFTAGVFTRASAFLIFACQLSLQHRNPHVMNSGDRLFLIVAALAVFLPLARRFSLSRWLAARRGGPAPGLAPGWGIRVVQLQVVYVYLFSCFAKLEQERWLDGLAIRDVMASPVYAEWPTHLSSDPLVNALTYGTLLFEFCFPILVWHPKLRRYALAAGVAFHAGIDAVMTIPMFSAIMVTTYALFLTDAEVASAARWLRSKLSSRLEAEARAAPERARF